MVGEPTVTVNLLALQMDMVLLGVGLFSPGKVCYNSNSFTKISNFLPHLHHIFAQSDWFSCQSTIPQHFCSKLNCSHRLRFKMFNKELTGK